MQAKVKQWLAYKRERRETYKPTGLQVLLGKIRNSVKLYGETAVCELIDNSMSSGYQGILFDRLQKPSSSKYVQQAASSMGQPTSAMMAAVQRVTNYNTEG
jgi:hypothetical protein